MTDDLTARAAVEYRADRDKALRAKRPKPVGNGEDISPFSEVALAEQFVERHPNLRFVAAWGKWMLWTGTHWRPDDTLHVFDLARLIAKEAARTCNKPKTASLIASAKTVAAIERLARSDRRLAASVDHWDADPWLLNTPIGVVDLRTGQLRAHRPEDYMTKMTAVGPSSAGCPTFMSFLARIAKEDEEHISYLRRMLGYSLTGVTREQALFFGHGTGGNGKGVFVKVVSGIWKDYHTQASMEMFMASKTDRHPTDLAGLRGARLVTATETEKGRQWAEARIKALTGEDLIRARFMRQDEFTYEATYKLFMIGNSTPRFEGGVDEAMRRRLHLIPFDVKIPEAERDRELADKLKAEAESILQWCIEGCLEWQRIGLNPPTTVVSATASYLADEDTVLAWIDDKCTFNADKFESSSALFASWSAWARANGEAAGSRKDFAKAIVSHGCVPDRATGGTRGFKGLRIAVDQPPDETPKTYRERRE